MAWEVMFYLGDRPEEGCVCPLHLDLFRMKEAQEFTVTVDRKETPECLECHKLLAENKRTSETLLAVITWCFPEYQPRKVPVVAPDRVAPFWRVGVQVNRIQSRRPLLHSKVTLYSLEDLLQFLQAEGGNEDTAHFARTMWDTLAAAYDANLAKQAPDKNGM